MSNPEIERLARIEYRCREKYHHMGMMDSNIASDKKEQQAVEYALAYAEWQKARMDLESAYVGKGEE